MNRKLMLGVLLGALAVAGAAVWMLTSEPSVEPGADALRRARDTATEQPSFHDTAGESSAVPAKPVQVERLPAAASPPVAAPAATPAGPVRRITGRVARISDDTPLGGAVVARVTVTDGVSSPAPGGVTTDAEAGTFTLSDVPLDETELSVALPDAWPRKTAFYPLPDVKGDIDGLLLTYDSGFLLAGLVTDAAGHPLAGATAGIDNLATATTDDAGRFELRDVAPGKGRLSVDVWAEAPWFVRDTRAVNAPTDSRQIAHVELALQGSGAIEGRVTDPKRDPVADTRIRIAASINRAHAESGAASLVTTTDADGNYRLDHVPEGVYLVQVGTDVFVPEGVSGDPSSAIARFAELGAAVRRERQRDQGLAPRWITDVGVQTGATTRLDVELTRGAIIEGRVTDASGNRLAGAEVSLERRIRWEAPEQSGSAVSFDGANTITSRSGEDGGAGETVFSSTEATMTTGEDGSYSFAVVSAGEKRVTAIDGEQRCAPKHIDLAVVGTEQHAAVDFVLSFGLSLRGRVTDPGGAVLKGVYVNIKPAGTQVFTNEGTTSTGDDGWFEVDGLPEGPHSMMLSKKGYAYRFEEVLPGDVPRDWVLQPAPQLHGSVHDALTGAPVLRFATTLSRERSVWQSGQDDHPEGHFTLDVDDDSLCTLSIEATGYEIETKEGIIPSSTVTAPLQFLLKPNP